VNSWPIHLEQRLKEQPIPSLLERIMKSQSDQPLPLSPVLKLPLPPVQFRNSPLSSGGLSNHREVGSSSGRYPSIEWEVSRHSDSTAISDIGADGKDEHFTMIASPPYPAGIELVACPLLLDFLNPLLRGSRFELLGKALRLASPVLSDVQDRNEARKLQAS
jgi:hypothetical protein